MGIKDDLTMTSWTNSMMRPHDLVFRVSVQKKCCEGQINWNRSSIHIPWQRRGGNRNLVQYRKLKNLLFSLSLNLWSMTHFHSWSLYSYLSTLPPAAIFTLGCLVRGKPALIWQEPKTALLSYLFFSFMYFLIYFRISSPKFHCLCHCSQFRALS